MVQGWKDIFEKAEKLGEGKNSAAYKSGDYIIRVPIQERARQGYLKEAEYSQTFQHSDDEFLKSLLPNVQYVKENGFEGAVHSELKGKTCIDGKDRSGDNLHFEDLSVLQKSVLASEVGQFLAHLHNFPVQGFEVSEQVGFQFETLPDLQQRNAEFYAQKGIDYHSPAKKNDNLVVCHNDFHGGNMALNDKAQSAGVLNGVFDLGEMGLNVPAKDFMTLYSGYGRAFVRECMDSYNEVAKQKMSMEELDYHFLNKMAEWYSYFEKEKPERLGMVEDKLKDFSADKRKEALDKMQALSGRKPEKHAKAAKLSGSVYHRDVSRGREM